MRIIEELSFLLEDLLGLAWWLVRAFVIVLAITAGTIAAIGAVGWVLRTLAGIL